MGESYYPGRHDQNNQTYMTRLRIASERDAEVLRFLRDNGKLTEPQRVQKAQTLDDVADSTIP